MRRLSRLHLLIKSPVKSAPEKPSVASAIASMSTSPETGDFLRLAFRIESLLS